MTERYHAVEHLGYGSAFLKGYNNGNPKSRGGGQIAFEQQVNGLAALPGLSVTATFPTEVFNYMYPNKRNRRILPLQGPRMPNWTSDQFIDWYQDPDFQTAFEYTIKNLGGEIYSGHLAPSLAAADAIPHIPRVVRMHSMFSRYRTNEDMSNPDFAGTTTSKRIAIEDAAIRNPNLHMIFSTCAEMTQTAQVYSKALQINPEDLLTRFHHIPLGYDHFSVDRNNQDRFDSELRGKYEIPKNGQVAYLVGRRDPPKLFHHVLQSYFQALNNNRKEMNDSYLIIYGGSGGLPYEEQFIEAQEQSNGHIILAGAVSQQEAHGIRGTCIIPGPETFSLAMGEAGIAGNAIAPTLFCPELLEITHGLEGVFPIDPRSPDDLVQLFQEMREGSLLNRANDNRRLGKQFTWTNSVETHAQLLKKLIVG